MTHDTRYSVAYPAIAITCPFGDHGFHLAGLAVHPKRVAVGDEVFCHTCGLGLVIESVREMPGGSMEVGVRRRFPWERGMGSASKADEVGEADRGAEAASGAD